jgi:lipid-A-disaccharide synthase
MDILISAGEASGEAYGAELIQELRTLVPAARFFGLGGPRMRQAGCEITVEARDVAVVGLAEVVTHLPKIYGEFTKLVREGERRKPAAAVLIDFPDFNFRLAKKLHALGIPVFYYVSPQLWAWRRGRIKLVQKYVRKMLVIFPFEEQFYREHGVKVMFVGHPLADVRPPQVSREEFAQTNQLNPARTWIALLPGSRHKEIEMNLPEMLAAAQEMTAGGDFEFLVPAASTVRPEWLAGAVGRLAPRRADQELVVNVVMDARAALAFSRAAVVASGTATVEAAVIGVPFVMVYRVAPLTWHLGRRLVRVPFYAMPNLIAQREVVPELVQDRFTSENIVGWMRRLVPDGPDRAQMCAGLEEVRRKLHGSGDRERPARVAAATIASEMGFK